MPPGRLRASKHISRKQSEILCEAKHCHFFRCLLTMVAPPSMVAVILTLVDHQCRQMSLVSPSFGQMQFLLSSLAFNDLKLTSCFSCKKKRRKKILQKVKYYKNKKQVLRFFKLCSGLFSSLFPRNSQFMINIALIFLFVL